MFSAGNISEKLRVASFDCRREVVVDLYAGMINFVSARTIVGITGSALAADE